MGLVVAPAWWRSLQDPDLWWLLWAGEQLLDGQLPRHNTLSFTAPDTPWVLHEPLVALVYAAVGVEGVGWLRGLLLSLTGLLLLRLARRANSGWATVLALLWMGPLVSMGVSERALAWGHALLALLLVMLAQVDRSRWWAPAAALLVGLWASVHGSFVLGLAALLLHRPGWGLLAAALTLLNPNGLALWQLVLGYGVGSGSMGLVHGLIQEWTPLDPREPVQALQGALLLGGAALALKSGSWRERALVVLTVALALRHQRGVAPAAIVCLPLVSRALSAWLPERPLGTPGPLLAAGLAVVAVLSPTPQVDRILFPPGLLSELPDHEPIWADLRLGGWLGYHGKPVFWDPRNDCYPPKVLEDGARVAWQVGEWEAVLQRWDVGTVVTADSSLRAALMHTGWRQDGETREYTVMKKVESPASAGEQR